LKSLKKYIFSIAQLENKAYNLEIDGSDEFFKHFELESVNKGNFNALINLNKSETMIHLDFEISGVLNLICDRSLENFDFPFTTKESLILKFGDHDEDLADGIRLINRNAQSIDFSQEIYELITLTIPMKKLHPRFLDSLGDENEEGILVYSTEKPETNTKTENAIDPRWAALQNLKQDSN
jgi:uncharacterized metal-binding protein YceD (DUF177 family)